MKSMAKFVVGFYWVTQLGISVVVPIVLCTIGGLWLRNRYGLGIWIVLVGIFIGLLTAASSVISLYKKFWKQRNKENEEKPPVNFNSHD